MLTENFIAATHSLRPPAAHTSSALKDVGIFLHEFQPQSIFRQGYKKSSVYKQCLAVSDSHIFAAQADKAIVHVYSRERGNQEVTVPFPDRIASLAYAEKAAVLIIGTEDGKLILWEVATGRVSTSAASHLQSVSTLALTPNDDYILSGSADSSVHVWSLMELISFRQPRNDYNNAEAPSNAPIATFSTHRKPIKALAVGRSASNTNFAVSASADQTCYIWHIETCQILRTILLPSIPSCLVLDPADRAIYVGSEDGTLQSIEIVSKSAGTSKASIFSAVDIAPIQLPPENIWTASSTDIGAVNCLTAIYDGTTLISGHANGAIIRWDTAKRRVVTEITNLFQPVTNLVMLRPEGLHHNISQFRISAVVKPRLELNTDPDVGSVGISSKYVMMAQVTSPGNGRNDSTTAIRSNGFPQTMLDDALQALFAKSAGISQKASSNGIDKSATDKHLGKIERLEDEVNSLKSKLAVQQRINQERTDKHLARTKRRDALGLEKRQAYFAAQKQGKDGDEAMKPYEQKEIELDIESDKDVLSPMSDEKDVDMEG